MDPSAPNRTRSLAAPSSSESSLASAATISGSCTWANVRPSAEEWYPRLHIGWNHKECVDVYCYFTSRPFNADFKIKWAIHPSGPPFHGRPHLRSFDHILQLVNTQSNSDMMNAIAVGLSTQYHWQTKFKEDTPIYKHVELTPEETLTAWDKRSLDISEDGNAEKVRDAVLLTFGFYITKAEVELLTRFSDLRKVSVFETNTWRRMMCFRCCPTLDIEGSLAAPIPRKENPRKRKSNDNDQPSSKRPARSTDAAASRCLISETSTSTDQGSDPSEQVDTAPLAASPSADRATTAGTDEHQASNSPEAIDTASKSESPNTMSEDLSTTLTISSWLRLISDLTNQSSTTIRKWLNECFAIESTMEDVTTITESAKAKNISPLQTTAFKCMIATARKDLGAILMSPHVPKGLEFSRRGPLRASFNDSEAAMKRVSGGVRAGGRGSANQS